MGKWLLVGAAKGACVRVNSRHFQFGIVIVIDSLGWVLKYFLQCCEKEFNFFFPPLEKVEPNQPLRKIEPNLGFTFFKGKDK
jgi:hypothetical protein